MANLVLDQWIDIGAKPCSEITPTAFREVDMPLNSASYDAARNKIYAASLGRIFRFNGSTGAREAVSRIFTPQIGDEVYCSYDLTTDSIWVPQWRSTAQGNATTAALRNDHLLKINPTTLAVTTDFDIGADLGNSSFQAVGGPRKIRTNAGLGYITNIKVETPRTDTYLYDLNNIAASWIANQNHGDSGMWECIDIANGTFFYANSEERQVRTCGLLTLSDVDGIGNSALINTARRIYGTCWSTMNSRVYACTRTQFVHKLEIGGALSDITIDLGRTNANPHNIRFNANNNRVYAPLYADDTVAIINPADDSFVIQTGFDSPFDCVFSATKAFALQHSSVGLKEIV